MGLFTGRQTLLEREAFVLLGTLLRGRGQGQLIEGLGVRACSLRRLP
jgi:predicted xylose isomerase-like sugar epimerase